MAMRMIDRIKALQERNQKSGVGSFSGGDIFFKFTEGTHHIRLVGEWVTIKSHWIGPSTYNKALLFDEDEFKGENPLKRSVTCSNFDTQTEMTVEHGKETCALCALNEAAFSLLRDKRLSEEQRQSLKDIMSSARPNERYFFLCIDRDNPEIEEGRNGFKIIEFPKSLMEQWSLLVQEHDDTDCISDENGVDWVITKKKDGAKTKYTISYATSGRNIKQTPLTEEELAYERPDIRKIMGKQADMADIYSRMLDEYRDMLDDAGYKPPVSEKEGESQGSGNGQPSASRKAASAPKDDDNFDDENVPF